MKNLKNNFFTGLLLLGIVFFNFSCLQCQRNKNDIKLLQKINNTKVPQKRKLLIAVVNPGLQFQKYVYNQDLLVVKYLDEKMIVKNDFDVDYKKLEENILRLYPNKDDKGVCFMDIEAPYILPLINNEKDSPEFQKAQNLYINSIKFSKKLRPNVLWGHYGFPMTSLEEEKVIDSNKKLDEIFSTVDVFFPSLYLFKDDQATSYDFNYDYLKRNTENAIKLGIKFKKQVYPFVMHRFHSYDNRLQFKEMSDDYWKLYVKSIFTINVNGKYADGIVWWGADTYFFGSKEGHNLRKEFKGDPNNFVNLNDRMLIRKANVVEKVLK